MKYTLLKFYFEQNNSPTEVNINEKSTVPPNIFLVLFFFLNYIICQLIEDNF
jgi:hypothetical protein